MRDICPDPLFSRRQILRSGAGAALVAAGGWPVAAIAQPYERWPTVTKLAQDYVRSRRVANMVACLGRGDGPVEAIPVGTHLMGGRTLVNADSLYRIYSMTKPITGMAAMMLIDDGKLELDQPLAEWIPEFGKMQVQKVYDGPITRDNLEPAQRDISIRHLLTHTAGLGYSIVQRGPIALAMMERGVVPGRISRMPLLELFGGQPAPSLKVFAEQAASLPLVYQPGLRWSYSISLDVLGRVIELASGQDFDLFLKERLFDPCGMDSTFFRVPRAQEYRLTSSYAAPTGLLTIPVDLARRSIFLDKPPFPMGGSGLVSSPHDYDRFLRMLAGRGVIDGRQVMSEKAVEMGTSNLLPPGTNGIGTRAGLYGFGAGGKLGWAGMTRAFGWDGAAGTIAFVDMESGQRAGLFTQYLPATAYPAFEQFQQAVRKDLAIQTG